MEKGRRELGGGIVRVEEYECMRVTPWNRGRLSQMQNFGVANAFATYFQRHTQFRGQLILYEKSSKKEKSESAGRVEEEERERREEGDVEAKVMKRKSLLDRIDNEC